MANNAISSMDKFIDQFAESFIPEEEQGYEFKLRPILDLSEMGTVGDQKFNASPNLTMTNLELGKITGLKGQNADKTREITQKGDYKIHNTVDVKIAIEGADELMNDYKFVEKLKTVVANDVITGNRTLPNRTSLMQF